MPYLTSVLDIAKTALLANQKALNVTSHNISNANTPGYTRQKPALAPMEDVNFGGLFFGTGVTVQNIERIYDNFQASQLRDSNSNLSRYESKGGLLKTIEAALNDFGGSGLSTPLSKFFNSFQDIANNPTSYAERSVALSNATMLADRFINIDSTIMRGISNNNTELEAKVKEINSLAGQVAELNYQIPSIEASGASANDLRDKRDAILDSLSKIIDIKTVENKSGQVDVYIGEGSFLVAGVKTNPLETAMNENSVTYDVKSNGTVINDKISGGSVKGVLEGSQYYLNVQNKLDLMSAALIKAVNLQHRQGFGLDGSTGLDFFASPSVYTAPGGANTGGAVISGGTISNLSLLTLNDYEVRFNTPANYTIVNTGTNAVVASGAYTSGNPVTVDGLTFTITNGPGAPAAGDTFKVSVTKNASRNISVSITDPNKIAAASAAAALPGDNTNAIALAGIKDSASVNGSTFSQYYNGVITDIGVQAGEAASNYTAQKKITEELQNTKDSVSGVSIEEEAINMVKLQRAYEAAAKVLTTADKMLDALLSLR